MRPLKDYSFIRGVNHRMGERDQTVRELSYAKRIGLNSIRFWMNYREYEKAPAEYLAKIKGFVQLCHE
ncbi:MAG: hypothetical protein CW338_08510, partial [Clostridiales bacterium]|nr:hypothetical protein [Clostridiales bacterium]